MGGRHRPNMWAGGTGRIRGREAQAEDGVRRHRAKRRESGGDRSGWSWMKIVERGRRMEGAGKR